jgi:predicted secreted Zn-dependent protease
MEKTNKIRLDVMIVVVLFSLLFLGLQAEAEAKSAVPIEGAKFSVSVSLKDNLKSLIGKDVVVNLRSGKTHQGFVKAVGDEFIHLEKLSGRDFYDALVRITDISSIELKFRDMK